MTRVDFYVLPDVDIDAKYRFACRLALRAIHAGRRVHVRTASAEAAEMLDELMWSYPEDRFLPHGVDKRPHAVAEGPDAADAAAAPIRIGHAEPAPGPDQVLVNLADDVPAFFARFERVAEVITEPERASGRARYRHYRERGYPLFHHDLDDWEAR